MHISLADVDRLFGSIAHKNVDTGLGEARFLLQRVKELPELMAAEATAC